MIPIKTSNEMKSMRKACRLSALILADVAAQVAPGMTTGDLDAYAAQRMRELGVKSAFLGYGGFPGYTCISLNEEVVHGIPGSRVINSGDIVSIDLGVETEGFIGDNAITVLVGTIAPETEHLCHVCRESLMAGIDAARAGKRVGDIGHAVQKVAEAAGFGVVRDYCGHGVGRRLHEDPQIPNFGKGGSGALLKSGMTLAIEPMINQGTFRIDVMPDGWTVKTHDRKPSAHFEHTVLIVSDGPAEILTHP
ncbi:MAG: type I methionyl aminopeptidase [Verrucomicrobiota bacterium]|jgi:methionyl aminopeptidase|nr:type I methionyl aminopeptidase [Verrucomicrobiota bacterium]